MFNRKGGLVSAAIMATLLAGCSSDDNDSSAIDVDVRLGQEDFRDAYVWSTDITDGGQVATDANGNPSYLEYDVGDEDRVEIGLTEEILHQFSIVAKAPDDILDVDGTTRVCQWVAGCNPGSGGNVAFGDRYAVDGHVWRAVTYALNDGEYVVVTPFTHLAAAVAYDRLYVESLNEWQTTGYFSAYSVLQSVDVMSTQLGVEDIQSTRPADLSRIDRFTGDQANMMDRIRYGALVAAWDYLQSQTPDLLESAAADLVANDGQWAEADADAEILTLAELFQTARDNLAALTVENATAAGYVALVISQLDADISALEAGALTDTVPASVESMLGNDHYEDFDVGLQRTKAFVDVLRDYQQSFFEDGYRDVIDAYVDDLKQFGDEHEQSLDAFVTAYQQTYELYSECYLNSGCPTPDGSRNWLQSIDSFSVASGELSLNGGEIVVNQRVADIYTTDDIDYPSQSQAIDVLIVGQYLIEGTLFDVNHYYKDDDSDNEIQRPSSMRVFYTEEVRNLERPENNEILGYEMRWGDFEIVDQSDLGTDDELQIEGFFRLFYRGVRDPQNPDSELRFNIDSVVLDGRVSDRVTDDDDDDTQLTNLYIAAQAANAREFYPNQQFASFNGFFDASTAPGAVKGSTEADFMTYRTGEQTIAGQLVEYLDVIVPMGESIRYRLYPSVQREDENDRDGDDDRDEKLFTHDIELCYLERQNNSWVVSSCEPTERQYGEADFTEFVSDLWKTGALSRFEVDGRGQYFVEWPASTTDARGCLVLDELEAEASGFSGVLYDPMVLGLNSARLQTEVRMDDQPRTIFDIYVSAPTADDYAVTAALSHDYSSLSSSGNIQVGTGSDLDRIRLSYRTDRTFSTLGSLAIYKDGVRLTLDDGATETVDSTLSLYLNESKQLDPLPYEYFVNDEGEYEQCVLANQAEWNETVDLASSSFFLNYRGAVYGKVQQENGVWIVRYIDGEFETLQ